MEALCTYPLYSPPTAIREINLTYEYAEIGNVARYPCTFRMPCGRADVLLRYPATLHESVSFLFSYTSPLHRIDDELLTLLNLDLSFPVKLHIT